MDLNLLICYDPKKKKKLKSIEQAEVRRYHSMSLDIMYNLEADSEK